MAAETPLFLVHLLGFAAFLWHGLYVLSRGDGGHIARLTAITALVTCCLFGFSGFQEAIHTSPMDTRVLVDRLIWWAAVLPGALWLHLSLSLNLRAAAASWRRPTILVGYGAALALIALGAVTDSIRHYDTGGVPDAAGPLYILYVLFILACAGMAAAALATMRAPDGDGSAGAIEVRMLLAGALCFLLGAGYESLRQLLHSGWSEFPGWLLLVVGLGAVGGTVGVQSNLLLGRDVRRDFLYNFTGLIVLLVPYLAISGALVGFDDTRHRLLALLLTALITTGHTLYDRARERLDAAFFSPPVREERAAARAYVEALATQPVGPNPELATRKQFDDAVRRALTHLSDPTKLATSPLLNLATVARAVQDQSLEDDRLTRAAALKEILLELLDGLKPADGTGGPTADAARFYNCLYFPYVRGVSRRRAPTIQRQLRERRQRDGTARSDLERVVDWLIQVDEDTFYKWQRRGSDTIAAALRERERAAGGAVPDESTQSVTPEAVPAAV